MHSFIEFTQMLSAFFNTPVGFACLWTAISGVFVWLLMKYEPFNAAWKKYEGTIITGIKLAEQRIPDTTENKGLAKLDSALKYVINAYTVAHNGKSPPEKLVQAFKEGIQIKHAELDRFGNISKKTTRVIGIMLICLTVFCVAGCGVPAGKDISSGIGGGNSIKLDSSNNNVIVLTDGQIEPENIVEKAGKIVVPNVPLPVPREIDSSGKEKSSDSDNDPENKPDSAT